MPRGFTQANFDLLNARILLLSKSREDFLNSNVIAIGGIEQFIEATRMFRPKALQLHFFKNACPQIPNSLFELFFDVSPASVSIINTSRDPYMGADSDNLDIAELPSSMQEVQIASNMAYCLGYMGISEENNNLPQLRQPRSSDLDDSSFIRLKDSILASFEDGFSAQFADSQQEFEESRTDLSQVSFEDDEGDDFFDLGEVVEETPVEDVVEEVIEETPVETSDDRPDIYTMPIVEGSRLSADDFVSAEDLNRAVGNNGSEIWDKVFGILTSAQRLLQLGYEPERIKNFYENLKIRGFNPLRVRMERGAYYVLSIEAERRNVRRFNSSTYIPILNRLIGNTSTADLPSNLRPVRFTGGGNSGSILFGQLAIPPVMGVSDFDTIVSPNFVEERYIIERYERAYLVSGGSTEPVSTQTTTEAQATESVTLGTRRSGYTLIGYQFARSQMLYGNEVRLVPMPKSISEYDMSEGQNNAFVFYFLGVDEGAYTLKKLQWGSLTDYPDEYGNIFFRNARDRQRFREYLASNPRLSTPNTLKLSDVEFPVDNFLRDLKDNRSYTPQFSSRVTATIDLSQELFSIGDIDSLIDTLPSQEITTGISSAQAKAIGDAQMSESNTLGFEFEGGHATLGMSQLARQYRQKGISMNAESYNHTTRPQWKLVPDGSLGGVPNAFELVSPILTGSQGIENLRECLKVSQELGVQIFQQGGVHIHFGNSNWDMRVRKNILLNQYQMSDWLQATQPMHRRKNRWALPFTFKRRRGEVVPISYTEFKSNVERSVSEATLTVNVVNTDRYREINITNTRQPTWEWRFPQGNIEVDTNVNMVRLIDKLIEVSKVGVLGADNLTVNGMKEWMGVDLYTFWRNRIYDLSQTGRTGSPSYEHSDYIN